MARNTLAPMILAASIFAVPALAATPPSDTATNSPPAAEHTMPPTHQTATPPANNMAATTPGDHAGTAATPSHTAATQSETPRYTTGDGELRLGKIVGASVYNDNNQSVGSIDDVLMSENHKATMAVISVGGFLGMGGKLVSVPFDQLKIDKDRIMMPGATKQSLTSMPEYKYNNA